MEKTILRLEKLERDWDFSNQGKVKLKRTNYAGYYPENREENIKFINFVMDQTDEVYFSFAPDVDDIGELQDLLRKSKWSFLCDIATDLTYAKGPESPYTCDGEYLLFVKNCDQLRDFLLERRDIFDFDEYDESVSLIKIENPTFIRDGEVFCYTLSHESECMIEEKLYDDFMLTLQ